MGAFFLIRGHRVARGGPVIMVQVVRSVVSVTMVQVARGGSAQKTRNSGRQAEKKSR